MLQLRRSIASVAATLSLTAVVTAAAALSGGCTTTNKVTKVGPGETETTGERRESQPCKKGNVTLPIEAFDINPTEGLVCGLSNVLDEDGAFTDLDGPAGSEHTIAGEKVTGCAAVEFSDGVTISSVIMKMQPMAAACSTPCTEGGSSGCGTGRTVKIFVGTSLSKLQYLQPLELNKKELFEYRVAVFPEYKAKFAVVCRDATPETGDDVGIDSLSALCL